jgi:hypothetical protein
MKLKLEWKNSELNNRLQFGRLLARDKDNEPWTEIAQVMANDEGDEITSKAFLALGTQLPALGMTVFHY